jgi:alpha-tubulin suppressor-like RCC1 family protein
MASGVTSANAGSVHMCAIKLGAVWCWGSNGFATLGQGTCCGGPSNVPVAVALGGPNTASVLAAGAAHTCALRTDGPVLCWGR